jgi:hypothetical protein
MNTKASINTIYEDDTSSDQNLINTVCVEITYFPDNLPALKSYYLMSQTEHKDLITLYMDLYIEDFINGEELTKDKMDIYVINNSNNIKVCRNFLKTFGNPFDILNLINEKKKEFEYNQKKFCSLSQKKTKQNLINDNFSDTSKSDNEDNVFQNNKNNNSDSDSDSDSDDYINTMTEIIGTYNKTKNIDEAKLKKLTESKPETLFDNIIGEIAKTSKSKTKNKN